MSRNYALTNKSKAYMLWKLRFQMEAKGKTPSEALAHLTHYPRWKVLFDRWMLRSIGTTLNILNGTSDQTKLNIYRRLWDEYFDSIPTKPDSWIEKHRLMRKAPEPTWHVWVAPTGGDEGKGEPTEGKGEPTEGKGEGGEYEIKRGNNGREPVDTPRRAQSEWEREADRKIEELGRQHNDRPEATRDGRNKKVLAKEVPKATQLIGKVRKALLADSRNRIARNRDSGEIDMHKIHQIAQLTDVNTVYKRTTRGKKLDACVQIYIDESGSMNSNSVHNGKSYNRMSYAAAAAACLSKAMDQLRIPHQLIYYTCEIYLGKNWKGKWQKAMLEDACPCGGTNVPYALRSGLKMMKGRREQRKIAIVITDGDMATTDPFWRTNGQWAKLRREGYEVYAIGLMTQVLTSNPKQPNHEWWGSVGVGETVYHYANEGAYKSGSKPIRQSVGINGGIDNVKPDTMIPQLAKHLVEVFTEGREVIR
jgi:hypothetical protein